MRNFLLGGVLIVLGLSGCRGAESPAPAQAPGFEEPIVARLRAAGLVPGAFASVDAAPYGADRCVRGPVDRLDTLLCSFASDQMASEAQAKLRAFAQGAVSGAERHSGAVALVVADRDRVDLQGKQISRLVRAFSGDGQ